MKGFQLFPNEHVYSGLIRYRFRSAQAYMSDKRFFAHNHLPYHWFRSQVPLNHLMRETLDSIAPEPDKQFALRLNHTPFAPWLLSLPDGMAPHTLKESNHRPNTEENPFQVDRRWKYCPSCMQMQKAKWGVSYWRVTHQLPGALVCDEHGSPLHSHDALRYLNFTLPDKWEGTSTPVSMVDAWKVSWQPFIYAIARRLQCQPTWGVELRDSIYEVLKLSKPLRRGDRTVVNALFAQMRDELGEACLAGLFTAYARQFTRPTNVLWITLSPFGQSKGLRHPLYWLAIVFWLREQLPALKDEYENGDTTTL